jgi:hypothetical protein
MTRFSFRHVSGPRERPSATRPGDISRVREGTVAGLTPKQQRFAAEYVVDLNETQAAIRAGYSAHTAQKNAHRLMSNAGVQVVIAEKMKAREQDTGVTAAWVLLRLRAEAEFTGEGSSHAARVSALGLAMRHLGMFLEDAPHPDRPAFDLTRLTDEQKRDLLAALRAARS